ncbi:MAG: type VI secretion system lipoprotein TssJ [Gammaproteobacteria bacterium]|nr:type VI secretion system lipoprotein TssJ [Gammaproteobacteria bacterium]
MEFKRLSFRFFVFLLLISTSACSSKLLVPFATWAQIDFKIATDVNPDSGDRPSPIVVRLYELSEIGEFQGKEFFDIYDNDGEALKATLLAKEEFNFRPGESSFIERKLKEDTQYIGILAAFRSIDDARWRGFVKLNKNRTNRMSVTLKGVNADVRLTR